MQDGPELEGLPELARAPTAEVEAFVDVESTMVDGAGLRYEAGVALDVDATPMGWRGLGLVLDVRSIRGEPVGVDSRGGASSLENPEVDALADAFVRWRAARDGLVLRAGVVDGNRAFGAFEAVDGFLHAAAITPPTIVGLPAAPVSAPGAELEMRSEDAQLTVGVFDGDRAGVGTTTELGVRDDGELRPELGTLAIAQATVELGSSRLTGGAHWNDGAGSVVGGYGMVESEIFEGAVAFGMLGRNAGGSEIVRQHVMGGVAIESPFGLGLPGSGRDPGRVGALWSQTRSAEGASAREDVAELFYRHALGDDSTITLSGQYLREADASGVADAVVLGLRFSSSF